MNEFPPIERSFSYGVILIDRLMEVEHPCPVAILESGISVPARDAGEIIPDDLMDSSDFSLQLMHPEFQRHGYVTRISGRVTPCFDCRRTLRRNSHHRIRIPALRVEHISRELFGEIFAGRTAQGLLHRMGAKVLRNSLAILHPLTLGECRGTRLFVVNARNGLAARRPLRSQTARK